MRSIPYCPISKRPALSAALLITLLLLLPGTALAQMEEEEAQPAAEEPITEPATESEDRGEEAGEQDMSEKGAGNTDVIVTDRPTFGASPLVVGFLRFQLETGVDIGKKEDGFVGDVITYTIPTKLRFGVWGDILEIHLESSTFTWVDVVDGPVIDFGNIDVGAKATLLQGGGAVPALGVLVALTTPGTAGVNPNDDYFFTGTLLASWSLPAALGLWANFGSSHGLTSRGETGDTLRYALGLGWAVTPLTEDLGVFAELFGATRVDESSDFDLQFDGGFTYLILPRFQIDAYIRAGITGDANDDIGGGFGLAFKI